MDSSNNLNQEQEINKESKQARRHRKSNRSITAQYIVYLLALLLSFAACLAAINYALNWPHLAFKEINNNKVNIKSVEKTQKVLSVPNFVGLDINQARKKASNLGFHLTVKEWSSSNFDAVNSIISQSPEPGKKLMQGKNIEVKVSTGKIKSKFKNSRYKLNLPAIAENPKPLATPPIQKNNLLSGKIVVIDAGHQKHADLSLEPIGPGARTMKEKTQGGTTGTLSRIPEYEITLQIANKIKEELEADGVTVIMTRTSNDVKLSNVERAQIANKANADLAVRIHADGSTDKTKKGISILYPARNKWTTEIYKNSLKAANIIHEKLIEQLNCKDNGLVARNDLTGFNWSKVPVILVETGFLTNDEEEKKLIDSNYQKAIAKALASGVVEYFQKESNP